MRIKKIIGLSTGILAFGTLFSITSVKAMEANSKDFSSYVNCYKGDVYNTPTYIAPLTRNNKYNVGRKCYAQYKDKDITGSPRITNYGFKINGEFYTSPVLLDTNGLYLIETYPTVQEGNIIKPKGTTALETIYVMVDLDYSVELKTTNYMTDAYDSVNAFLEALKSNFNQDVIIDSASELSLKNTFLDCKKNNTKKTISIKVSYENIDYNFNVTISSSNDEIKNSFVNLGDASLNIKPIAIQYSPDYKNEYVSSSLRSYLTESIINDLGLAPEQSVDIDFTDDKLYPSLNSTDHKALSIGVTISDTIIPTNMVKTNIYIMIYQPYYVKGDYLKIEYKSMDYLATQTEVNSYRTYLAITDDKNTYYDYSANVSVTFVLNTDNKTLKANLAYQNIKTVVSDTINVVTSPTDLRIVTNYNYIILPQKDSLNYKDQVGVLINNKFYKSSDVKGYYFTWDILEDENDDYLIVSMYDFKSNEQVGNKKAKIIYENTENRNFFEKMLYGYGKFLRKIF